MALGNDLTDNRVSRQIAERRSQDAVLLRVEQKSVSNLSVDFVMGFAADIQKATRALEVNTRPIDIIGQRQRTGAAIAQ